MSLFTGTDYANEWVMVGTNDREVMAFRRPAAPSAFGGLDWEGRCERADRREPDYYNLAELLTQLGILPTAPSQPA